MMKHWLWAALIVSSALHASVTVDPDLKLTPEQTAYAQNALKDISVVATGARFASVFPNASKDLPRSCEYKLTLQDFKEMPLAHQGRLLGLRWISEPTCKSYGRIFSTRIVWILPDGALQTIAEREAFDPECESAEYSYLPIGLKTLFKEEWIYFEEGVHVHGCIGAHERKYTLGHFFHPKKIKLTSILLNRDDEIDEEGRRLQKSYVIEDKHCKGNVCQVQKTVTLLQPAKKPMVLEKKRTKVTYSPETMTIGHE